MYVCIFVYATRFERTCRFHCIDPKVASAGYIPCHTYLPLSIDPPWWKVSGVPRRLDILRNVDTGMVFWIQRTGQVLCSVYSSSSHHRDMTDMSIPWSAPPPMIPVATRRFFFLKLWALGFVSKKGHFPLASWEGQSTRNQKLYLCIYIPFHQTKHECLGDQEITKNQMFLGFWISQDQVLSQSWIWWLLGSVIGRNRPSRML